MHESGARRPLTRRERELVAEIAAGASNKTIAARFGVSQQTVRNQLSTLFRKLNVSSRLELAVKFANRDVSEL
jgi:two-component system nitrate/nitrite response regulator NarL